MTATMNAVELDEDRYSDDSFQDDFESESEATPVRPTHNAEPTTSEEASPARAAESASTPTRSSTSRSSSSSSSSANSASAADAAVARYSSRHSSVMHSEIKSPPAAAPATHDEASPAASKSTKSTSTSSASSHRSSRSSASGRSGADAAGASQHDAAYPNDAPATAVAAHAEDAEDEEAASSVLPADQVYDKGHERRADGSHSHTGREPTPHGAASTHNNSTADHQRLRRPAVPETADELREMQSENALLREELFQRSREQYHTALTQSTKGGTANTFNGNRTVSGPGSSRKTAMATTAGAAHASAVARQREATARLVQESLSLHRSLQVMRLEQRELLQRREELRTLVSRYKKALKYKELVETAKQDIIDLTDDHRDVHLEVRCNEKLLVLNDAMTETGTGQRRLQEEIRAQNALTQRRREHALRDADSAQRMRDAAAKRVEELRTELERRRENATAGADTDCLHLRVVNQAKKDRARELRAQLEQLQLEHHGTSSPAGRGKGGRQSQNSLKPRAHPQSVRDDAEREYLQNRIAEMRREHESTAADGPQAEASAAVSAAGGPSAASPHSLVSEPPAAGPAAGALSRHSSHRTNGSIASAMATHGPAASTIPPSAAAAAAAEQPAPQQTQEIDVTAWLNAHPVEPVTTGPSVGAAHTLRNSHELTGVAAAHAYAEEPVVVAPYTVEAEPEPSAYKEDWQQPAQHQEEQHQPEPSAAARVSTTGNETPAWLDAGEPDGAAAPEEQPTGSPRYAEEDVEEDPMEEEEEVGMEEDYPEEAEDGYDAAPEAAAAPAPHQQDAGLDEAMFGIGAGPAAPAAAAETNDDGPDWLNF